jgi:hypothetical protein
VTWIFDSGYVVFVFFLSSAVSPSSVKLGEWTGQSCDQCSAEKSVAEVVTVTVLARLSGPARVAISVVQRSRWQKWLR